MKQLEFFFGRVPYEWDGEAANDFVEKVIGEEITKQLTIESNILRDRNGRHKGCAKVIITGIQMILPYVKNVLIAANEKYSVGEKELKLRIEPWKKGDDNANSN